MFKQIIAIGSWLTCIWLLSAWEFGAVGKWALFFVIGVPVVWVTMFAFSEWKWQDEERRRERSDKRRTRKMIEQTNKEMYLRGIAS